MRVATVNLKTVCVPDSLRVHHKVTGATRVFVKGFILWGDLHVFEILDYTTEEHVFGSGGNGGNGGAGGSTWTKAVYRVKV